MSNFYVKNGDSVHMLHHCIISGVTNDEKWLMLTGQTILSLWLFGASYAVDASGEC